MNMHELGMNMAWTVHEVTMIVGIKAWNMGRNSQISWVLLGKIYCVLSMNMGMYMPKNHELFLPGVLSEPLVLWRKGDGF